MLKCTYIWTANGHTYSKETLLLAADRPNALFSFSFLYFLIWADNVFCDTLYAFSHSCLWMATCWSMFYVKLYIYLSYKLNKRSLLMTGSCRTAFANSFILCFRYKWNYVNQMMKVIERMKNCHILNNRPEFSQMCNGNFSQNIPAESRNL